MPSTTNALLQERIIDILKASLGPCGILLDDDRLVELQCNPDGRVWARWQGVTRAQETPHWMPETQRDLVLRIVAGRMELLCNAQQPSLSTILPSGERFQGFRPPIAPGPGFVIRKPALRVFTLADYVHAKIILPAHAEILLAAVQAYRNILIGGGTLTGKTTLANALLAIMADAGERVITLEDTPELQCTAPNTVQKYTEPGIKTMYALVQDALREGPDRLIMGEIRGVEAVDLMDAWATGHPGGLCTVHAGSAMGVLAMMEQRMRRGQVPQEVAREMLGNAQPVIAYLERTPTGRVLKEMISVNGYAEGAYQVSTL
jgi:P-type conjugative transfer ATPase TrbB